MYVKNHHSDSLSIAKWNCQPLAYREQKETYDIDEQKITSPSQVVIFDLIMNTPCPFAHGAP